MYAAITNRWDAVPLKTSPDFHAAFHCCNMDIAKWLGHSHCHCYGYRYKRHVYCIAAIAQLWNFFSSISQHTHRPESIITTGFFTTHRIVYDRRDCKWMKVCKPPCWSDLFFLFFLYSLLTKLVLSGLSSVVIIFFSFSIFRHAATMLGYLASSLLVISTIYWIDPSSAGPLDALSWARMDNINLPWLPCKLSKLSYTLV